MKIKILFTTTLSLSILIISAMADQTVDPAKKLADSVCSACHGQDGNSPLTMYPKIAGQGEGYLISSLKEFKKADKGKRNNPVMYMSVEKLTDDDISILASYFSNQTTTPGAAAESLVTTGQAIYRGGLIDQGVPACMACHGPTGAGLSSARYPKVSGQHPEYLVDQLKKFKSGERKDIIGGMMNDIAMKLSEDEILAVSSYMSGVH